MLYCEHISCQGAFKEGGWLEFCHIYWKMEGSVINHTTTTFISNQTVKTSCKNLGGQEEPSYEFTSSLRSFPCVGSIKLLWIVQRYSSPGGAQPAPAGVPGGSGGDRGLSEPPAVSAAPPGGRHLLLVAESSTSSGQDGAEGAAAGTECWSCTETQSRYETAMLFKGTVHHKKINQSKVRVFHPSGLCWFELWSQILVDFLFIE